MSDVRPLFTVWSTWLVLMAGANVAAPLYEVYASRFGFSSLVLTAIFTTYAVVLVPTLLVFGRVSDRLGRRPVILAGMAAAAVGLVLFAAAGGVVWLFVARAFQGLAVGTVSGAATAALVELDPAAGGGRPALLAGLAQAAGSALGPLVSGPLAQWAPYPLRLSYVVVLAATVAGGALMLLMPEPAGRDREPWRIQRPRVPAEIRRDFARVSLTAATVWASVALCLSIVPSYAGDLLATENLALLGAVSAVALGASCASQIAAQRRSTEQRGAQSAGLVVLAAGLVALASASALHSLAVLLVGAVAVGGGHGVAFLNAQDELNRIAPSEHRGEVTAAFISCIYALVGGAVLASGLLDEGVSLTIAVSLVAVTLAATALLGAGWQIRARPARGRGHPAST
jgi:predicted MFS family arabinose efflux permease